MNSEPTRELDVGPAAHFSDKRPTTESPAWEQVAEGRYMPRRFKGSFKGRALG